jgi:hypothetical protein
MCNRFLVASSTTLNSSLQDGPQDGIEEEERRFVHFYVRYKNHANSWRMEEGLKITASNKQATDFMNFSSSSCYCPRRHSMFASEAAAALAPASTTTLQRSKFYEEAVWELLKARAILCASYVYGYFHLDEHKAAKSLFDLMQHELEDATERLSEMMSRQYLRTPRRVVILGGQNCRRKRQDFLKAVYNGLVFEADPWMNRNCGGKFKPKTLEAAATEANRKIWTKTLSYPNNKKCRGPGCKNTCNNVRSSTKNFCSPACASASRTDSGGTSLHHTRRVFSDLHNTLPRTSKSEDDLLNKSRGFGGLCKRPGCTNNVCNKTTSSSAATFINSYCSVACAHYVNSLKKCNNEVENGGGHQKSESLKNPVTASSSTEEAAPMAALGANEKIEAVVKAAGYMPLLNDGNSTTSEDTLKNTITPVTGAAAASVEAAAAVVRNTVETTSQRRNRPKFVRQKSFDIDSGDSTDTSLADVSNIVSEAASMTVSNNRRASLAKIESSKLPTLPETTTVATITTTITTAPAEAEAAETKTTTSTARVKKRPALTIKIQNSSFNDDADEEEFASELEKSPNFHISGVNISRSPGGSSVASSISPRTLNNLASQNNRNRSSSLIVPPVITRRSSSGGSPGSKSLHLSPFNNSPASASTATTTWAAAAPNTLFTFPEPYSEAATVDSGLSSVLHVQENYLSSDDFHEALFFVEKSPKSGHKKRPRRSRRPVKNNVDNMELSGKKAGAEDISQLHSDLSISQL